MEMQLILIAFFVTFEVPQNVQSNNRQMRSNVQENLHDLFDSLNKNDRRKTETYRNILRQQAGREQESFDSMKEEFRVARQRNANLKLENFRVKIGNIDEKAAMFKRETEGKNDSQDPFTAEEERKVIKELDALVLKIPRPERHISNPNQYCINQCLQDAVVKKYDPQRAVNVTGIPWSKQPLYRKLAHSICDCVQSCGLVAGYDKFLMKLVEIILNPASLVLNLAREDEILANNLTSSMAGA